MALGCAGIGAFAIVLAGANFALPMVLVQSTS